ncbi:MAG: type II toxin-antitoxin system Phd/YefM family antitoxin [Candidatus Margulisbacteria bacterium]|jgi:PHD/YefM family antitoxin component YafN of YafNO toxin-antitoxin module|nr:type II toxin-antitoxin system Phd/YefM family antitoxin [Candidatus Margulisiibacteriota bacterium]
MSSINATAARQSFFKLLNGCINFSEIVNIVTPKGNAILLSAEEYRGLKETAYLCSLPGLRQSLLKARKTPLKKTKELKIDDL